MNTSDRVLPDTASIPSATRSLFERLSGVEAISGFFLIGGSALAINAQHRLSEDLVFVTAAIRLNRHALDEIIEGLRSSGCAVSWQDNPGLRLEFENDGLELDDYHRDYVVDGVKLTFFAAERETRKALVGISPICFGNIRVADTDTLFRTKAVLLTSRITKRDIFDLHYFLTRGGYRIGDLFDVIRECHPTYPYEAVRHRLLTQGFSVTDAGYDALVDRDITVEQLREDIHQQVNRCEAEWAGRQFEDFDTES